MRAFKLDMYERQLDQRKAALGLTGVDYVRPNSGVARTPEKRELLAAIAKTAQVKRHKLRFTANY